MKKILFVLLLIVLSVSLNAQQTCNPNYVDTNPNWVKRLTGNAYTWAFDENTRFDVTYAPTNTYITVEQMEAHIESAIGKWLYAIHGGNTNYTIINITKAANYASADIRIRFSDLGSNSMCGRFDLNDQIEINSVIRNQFDEPLSKVWTYTELQSTLTHEFGHFFMGPTNGNDGHVSNYDAIMYHLPCSDPHGVGITISTCEKDYVMNLYNPLHSVTVANNFGGYGGGKVKVDATEHLNIPSAGKVFDTWRKNSFPHTLEALTQQIVEPANGKTYNRLFDKWTNVESGTDDGNDSLSILPQSTTYRASFDKEFNVTLSSLTYIESNNGGYYTIDGNQVISTEIREEFSKQIQAFPQGSNWVLIDWKDADNTLRYGNPLTLTPTDHVVNLQGRFKQHLATNSAFSLSNNNQRKVVRDLNNIYHAVYESAGKIFYTSSTNAGTSWTNEVFVSNAPEINDLSSRNPAIDLYYDEISQSWKPIIVWETHNNENTVFYLFSNKMVGNSWEGITYASDEIFSTIDARPSLTFPYIVYQREDGLYVTRSTGSWWDIWSSSQIPGTTSASIKPCALFDRWNGTDVTHLTWEENGNIYYRSMTYSEGYNWSSSETVASGYEFVTHSTPSMTMNYAGAVWIAWEYRNTEAINANCIQVRKRLGQNSYGAISSFGQGVSGNRSYYNPSISGNRHWPGGGNNLSLIWQKSTNDIQRVSYVSGAWGTISTLAANNQTPQLEMNEYGGSITSKFGFSRGTSGTLYGLTSLSFSEGGLEKSSSHSAADQYKRGIITTVDSAASMIEFGNIAVSTQNGTKALIPLHVLPDTIPISSLNDVASYLRSEPFVAESNMELVLEVSEQLLSGKERQLENCDISYALELVDAQNNNILYTLHLTKLSDKKTALTILPYTLGSTGDKEVFIRLSVLPKNGVIPSVVAMNSFMDEETALAKGTKSANGKKIDLIPSQYNLGQNFPNPFNPVTTIQYQLPKNDFITLKVYDAVGREIMTLVEGMKEAGSYQVPFNASDLSSGLYFYTMRAGKYSSTKKMMLVK